MKIISISAANLQRMFRERSNIFFVFILPIGIILLVGAQFGGGVAPGVGVFQPDDDRLAAAIVDELEAEEGISIVSYGSNEELVRAVERGAVQAGTVIPTGMDQAAANGERIEFGFMSRSDGSGPQLQSFVSTAVARVMTPVAAAQFAAEEVGGDFEQALDVAMLTSDSGLGVDVETTAVGEALFPSSMGRFDLGASQQLVLFVFLTALAGSAALILTRQLGISSRMLSTPTPIWTIVLGEGAGRFGVALVQGLYIVFATLLLFRVDWGDPIGATLLIVTFSAVGAGAGLLAGALFVNDQQASGISIMLGLGLAALGGAMLPAELFSDTMQKIAHVTPHAWALDGFAELVRHNGSVVDILPQLGILTLYATLLLALASWRLRAVLTRPGG